MLSVIIPAHNEEPSLPQLLTSLKAQLEHLAEKYQIIVADNASTDATPDIARSHGADVIRENEKGYGAACLAGLTRLHPDSSIVIFLDADYSDYPEDLPAIIYPLQQGNADLVIGSRVLLKDSRKSLLIQQRLGNALAVNLIRLIWKHKFTDLGPFRAIRRDSLLKLNMQDHNFGWTIEMQIRAIKNGLNCQEVPVRYRKRIGVSKVSGTLKGTIFAGITIIRVILREWLFTT